MDVTRREAALLGLAAALGALAIGLGALLALGGGEPDLYTKENLALAYVAANTADDASVVDSEEIPLTTEEMAEYGVDAAYQLVIESADQQFSVVVIKKSGGGYGVAAVEAVQG
jgi:hypothetical protein